LTSEALAKGGRKPEESQKMKNGAGCWVLGAGKKNAKR